MAKYHGKGAELWLSTSGTTAPSKVLSLSRWSLDLSTDKVDSTEFGASNETQEIGFPKANGTFEGFYNDASGQSQLWSARNSSDGAILVLYPNYANAPSKNVSLNAWVDVTLEAGVKDMVAVRGTFSARGAATVAL